MKPSKLQRFRYVPLFVNATLMRLTRIGGPAALFLCAIALPQSSRAACPLPGPNQAVVYQHAHRGGNCAVLEIGNYFKPPFGSVQNDSISSIDIGSNVRVVLATDVYFWGNWSHWEGGFFYEYVGDQVNDETSPIMIRPRTGGPAAAWFLYNYPHARENFWAEHAQGIAHTTDSWIITTTEQMYVVPF